MILYPKYFYDGYPMDNYSCGMRQMLHSFRLRNSTRHKSFYRSNAKKILKQLRAIKNLRSKSQK